MFISPAFAQAATPAAGGNPITDMLIMFVPVIAIMYFLVIRPQSKRAKEHQNMLTALKRGDYVQTGGGLVGKIIKLMGDDEVQVELAENVRVRVVKSTIVGVRSKPEPIKGETGRKAKGPVAEPANDEDETEASDKKD